jgi:hypothetical protein
MASMVTGRSLSGKTTYGHVDGQQRRASSVGRQGAVVFIQAEEAIKWFGGPFVSS